MSATVVVPAPPGAVYEVLSEVGRVGEWSHEAQGARWVEGAGPEVGKVFRGTNRLGRLRWVRRCTVTSADPGVRFAYCTAGVVGDRTAWSFDLEPVRAGTRVTETYEIVRMPRLLEACVVRLMPSHLDRSAALAQDLERLGALAARRAML